MFQYDKIYQFRRVEEPNKFKQDFKRWPVFTETLSVIRQMQITTAMRLNKHFKT